jgi:mercuric ion binding protein
MNKILLMFMVTYLLLPATGLFAQNSVEVQVDGLACPFCAYGLEKKLSDLDGVDSLMIDIEKGMVTLIVQEDKTVNEEVIKEKIKEAGFTPGKITFDKSEQKKENDD